MRRLEGRAGAALARTDPRPLFALAATASGLLLIALQSRLSFAADEWAHPARQHPELPAMSIEDWQLWNEPNSLYFWKPAPDTKGYLTVLRAFHGAVRRADPDGRVLLGGLFPTPKGINMSAFMAALYRLGAAKLFHEADVHPYAADPERAMKATERLQGLLDREGDGEKPIRITEVGWASG